MATVQLGSISTGTLREIDLLPAFAEELRRLDPTSKLVAEYDALPNDWELDWQPGVDGQADVDYMVNEMQDALTELAPPHMYFGSIEGDGADFGFWPALDTLVDCERVQERVFPNGEVEYVDLDCNVYIHVNDHGNITVSKTEAVADGTGDYRLEPGQLLWDAV